eukprot:6735131-Prymnesium_polylepis.1
MLPHVRVRAKRPIHGASRSHERLAAERRPAVDRAPPSAPSARGLDRLPRAMGNAGSHPGHNLSLAHTLARSHPRTLMPSRPRTLAPSCPHALSPSRPRTLRPLSHRHPDHPGAVRLPDVVAAAAKQE